ncbi:MAG: DUF547 domain-containing protein [Gammaproteobacteria bacterium]|nr:DUF547 domain-containing protein [Gammaproteobacteria bacterium]
MSSKAVLTIQIRPGAFLLALLLSVFAVPSLAVDYDAAIKAWARVLDLYVDEAGRIDFHALSTDRADLDRFVGVLAKIGPGSRADLFNSPEKVLAYHINAYNALAMHGVIEAGIPEGFNRFFKRVRFFRFRKVKVDGATTNLYDYENDVIRPLGDPRIHFALNCMVRDCPRLPVKPFEAAMLESQLESATVDFFNNPRYLRADNGKREVWLSEILKFYTEDFVPSARARDLIGYVNPYVEAKIPTDYKVRFTPYDWTINQQP